MCQKTPCGDCYRIRLGKCEWLRSREGCHRALLCFLDSLLCLVYIAIVLVIACAAYLLCVGIGYPVMKKTNHGEVSAGDVWGLGFTLGVAISVGFMLVILFVWCICYEIRNCVQRDDYLLPCEKPTNYNKVSSTVPVINETEVTLSSSVEIM